jgi:hypothetical protein
MGIFPWPEISAEFRGADLLLGNGFSLRLHQSFHYDSLFDRFLANCDAAQADRFRQFGTSNFEAILESLQAAARVNAIFGIASDPLALATEALKQGLLTTVSQNHPLAIELNRDHLTAMSEAFDFFGDIFALSYDALLYHIIMITLDRRRLNAVVRPYNDYFWAQHDGEFLEFMNYQHLRHYKHIYYLHGALFIFRLGSSTVKLKRTDQTELLTLIEQKIGAGYIPLFVSEGSSEDKQLAISRSEYLQHANFHLQHGTNSLVIYGASLSRPDLHIVKAIRDTLRQIAFSIRVGEKTADELRAEMFRQREKLPEHAARFFDSSTLFAVG